MTNTKKLLDRLEYAANMWGSFRRAYDGERTIKNVTKDLRTVVEGLEREIVALRSAVDDAYERGLAERKGVDPSGTEATCPKCRGPIEVHRKK